MTEPADTKDQQAETVWLFGYGSLIYKADFEYLESSAAWITGWSRRFWQGSHDHRGVPGAPGRVVTLIAEPGAICSGIAYRVPISAFEHLDQREKDGYRRCEVAITLADNHQVSGLIYFAGADNPAFLGSATPVAIAEQIASASGASGDNRDYALDLARALRRLGSDDSHVFAVERALCASN